MTTGIYSITHPKVKGCYVGQAGTFDRRWREHKNDLVANTHDNYHLQSIVKRYGVNGLQFKVLEECDRPALNHEELKWIASQGTWNLRPNQQQAKAALGNGNSGGKAKKKFRLSSGVKFLFLMGCGALGFAVLGVIGFWICVVLGAIVTWGN